MNEILAIDFDHTICDSSNIPEGHKMGPPLPGAVAALNKLKAAGHTIIIHTCRANDGAKAIKVVEDWLKYFNASYDVVWSATLNGAKPVADVYIDDKGLHFQTWDQTLQELEARWR